MPPQVLIAFCTRSGSTQEVSEEMGRTIDGVGVTVDVKPMVEVKSIPEGQTVVLGAALYIGRFPKQFHEFVARFKQELSQARPLVFVLGPTENDPKHFATAEEQARKELKKYPWLHPADLRIVGGKFDPHTLKLSFLFSLVMMLPANPMKKIPPSDVRDWQLIHTWARAIAERCMPLV